MKNKFNKAVSLCEISGYIRGDLDLCDKQNYGSVIIAAL
jgi:hypothetical protein